MRRAQATRRCRPVIPWFVAPDCPSGGWTAEALESRVLFSALALGDVASFAPAAAGYEPQATLVRDSAGNLFGTTTAGGAHDDGTVFEIAAGSGSAAVTTLASFHGPDGAVPAAGVVLDASGNLFGTTQSGGAYRKGTVFELAKGGGTVTTLASFGGDDGFNPLGEVVLDSAGNLYGTTSGGGDSGNGTVFEVAKGDSGITTLASFGGDDGSGPQGTIALDSAGNLFGAASGGGPGGAGTVFEIPRGANAISLVASFSGASGAGPLGGVVLDSAGNLFGATSEGGAGGAGTVFEVAAGSAGGSTAITTLASFNGTNGSTPQGDLTLDSLGNIYGTATQGGAGGAGTVFKVARGSKAITALASFNGTNGSGPQGGVAVDASGNLYGTAYGGGAGVNAFGTVYQVAAGSGTITPLLTLRGADGGYPQSGVSFDAFGNLVGTTEIGGPADDGRVYEVARGTNAVTTLATFNGSNGSAPQAGVTSDSAGNLFGTTAGGGASGDGVVYEVARGSNAVTVLASFNGTNGANPAGGVVLDSSGSLFGTTTAGGTDDDGTVFEILKGSHTVTTLASFDATNGANPIGSIALDASGNLFGAAEFAGPNGSGTVFEVAKGSKAITVLAAFNGTNGDTPAGGVVLDSSGNLFGTTQGGGDANGDGTVFEVARGSNAITTLALLAGTNGANPQGNVVLDSAGNVFGTARTGGDEDGDGTVFEVAKGTNAVTTLALFDGASGSLPTGGLAPDGSGNLFGTTQTGGTANTGAVFELYQPAKLVFLQAPAGGTPGAALTPAVRVAVQDSAGNTLLADNSTVTLTLTGGTFADGTTNATALTVGGVATFPNLVVNSPGNYSLTATLGSVVSSPAAFIVAGPAVQAVAVSDGSTTAAQAQRSQVRQFVLTFASSTALGASQLSLSLLNSGGSGTSAGGGPAGNPADVSGALGPPTAVAGSNGTQWLVPVLPSTPWTDATGSLADGVYTLNISGVSGTGLTSLTFHRLFGDTDGNKSVNALDYARFKTAFGSGTGSAAYNADLDFDNSGAINALDYAQFKKRFGTTFTY